MVTHSSTSRPVQCLCMAERTGCPVFTDLWSYVTIFLLVVLCKPSFISTRAALPVCLSADRSGFSHQHHHAFQFLPKLIPLIAPEAVPTWNPWLLAPNDTLVATGLALSTAHSASFACIDAIIDLMIS